MEKAKKTNYYQNRKILRMTFFKFSELKNYPKISKNPKLKSHIIRPQIKKVRIETTIRIKKY